MVRGGSEDRNVHIGRKSHRVVRELNEQKEHVLRNH